MIASIRLNRQTKTIKVVNRRENIRLQHVRGSDVRLQHTGRVGPRGPMGPTGTRGQAFHVGLFQDEQTWHEKEIITVHHNLGTKFIKVASYMYSTQPQEDPPYDYQSYQDMVFVSKESNLEAGTYTVVDDDTIKICLTYGLNKYAESYVDDWSDPENPVTYPARYQHLWFDIALLFAGEKGVKGDKGDTGMSTFVRAHHGENADIARPDALYVEWVGSVPPMNATTEDTWIQTPV